MTTEDSEAEKAKFLADLKVRKYDRFERRIIQKILLAEAGDILAERWEALRCAFVVVWNQATKATRQVHYPLYRW
jgi:hypothetical protein